MTGVRITVDDRDLHQVLRRLARMGGEPGRFLKPIGLQIINSTRERARREVAPDFTPWPQLTPAHAQAKRGSHMMRDSGNLLGSLTREVEGDTLRVGTNRIYAAIHQFGGQAGRGRKVTMPARPWLGLSREDVTMIREEFEAFALRATRRG